MVGLGVCKFKEGAAGSSVRLCCISNGPQLALGLAWEWGFHPRGLVGRSLSAPERCKVAAWKAETCRWLFPHFAETLLTQLSL